MVNNYILTKEETENYLLALPDSQTNGYILPEPELDMYVDKINVGIVGSPTIFNGVISGFSTANCVQTGPEAIISGEYVFAFEIDKLTTATQVIIHSQLNFNIEIKNNKITAYNFGTSSDVNLFTPEISKVYYIKVNMDILSKTKTYYYSLDNGEKWIQVAQFTDSSLNPGTYGIRFGLSSSSSTNPFNGKIYLDKCYIKNTNGDIVWKGGTGNLVVKKDSCFYVPYGTTSNKLCNTAIYGALTSNNNVLSNFTATAYGILNNSLKRNDNITFIFAFTTGNNITTAQAIAHTEYLIALEILNGYLISYNWKNNTKDRIVKLVANTYYLVKLNINNKNRTFSYSTDNGITYSTPITFNDTSLSTTGSYEFLLGLISLNKNYPFLGSIDLKQCECRDSSGNLLWSGTKDAIQYSEGNFFEDNPCLEVVKKYINGNKVYYKVKANKNIAGYRGVDSVVRNRSIYIIPQVSESAGNLVAGMVTTEINSRLNSYASTASGGIYIESENRLAYSTTGRVEPERYYSFPLGLVSSGNGMVFDHISQVFNYMGFAGSTFYTLPGIRYSAANGKDNLGRAKSADITIDNVKTVTMNWVPSAENFFIDFASDILCDRHYAVSNTMPSSGYTMWYNPNENVMRISFSSSEFGGPELVVRLARFTHNNANPSKILTITPINDLQSVKNMYIIKGHITRGGVIPIYYKYIWSDFITPQLTENGTLGGNSFACRASSEIDSARKAWNAFDYTNNNSESYIWHSVEGLPQWFVFYNPNPLKISQIVIANRISHSTSGTVNAIKDYDLYASNNNIDWIYILSGQNTQGGSLKDWSIVIPEDTGLYKYWKIQIKSSQMTDKTGYVCIGEMNIYAKYITTIVESTKDDYDYVEYI